jgi:dihydrofolate synthase/folylpolyglutamate synthase
MPPEEVAAMLPTEKRGAAIVCADPADAWRRARADAAAEDLICVTGSVFLAGELRPTILADS